MSRVNTVSPDKANAEVKKIYKQLENKLGRVPNIFQNMGNSAAVLKGYLGLDEALSKTSLDPKIKEQIALTVGQANHCQYCLSAHTAIAKHAGLPDQDIIQARHGQAKDPKTQAILKFTITVVNNKGKVTNQDVASLKAAGVTDTELVEIILAITMNLFTNYFNLVTDPKVDFPEAPALT